MHNRSAVLLVVALVLTAAVGLAQTKRMTNDDVMAMVKASFEESTIITAIQSSEAGYDTSIQGMIALKEAGISEKIIAAMLEATKPKPAPVVVAPAGPEPLPDGIPSDVGIYIKIKGKWEEVYPEVANWKSGGAGKSFMTMGLTKGHINGTLKGKNAKVQVALPVDIAIRTMEGVSPTEYQLLKLDEKGDRREFRAVTGGVYHSSGGTDKNAVGFEFEKVASRTFRTRISGVKKGEYGFLAPSSGQAGGIGGGTSGAKVQGGSTQMGKVYAFRILE